MIRNERQCAKKKQIKRIWPVLVQGVYIHAAGHLNKGLYCTKATIACSIHHPPTSHESRPMSIQTRARIHNDNCKNVDCRWSTCRIPGADPRLHSCRPAVDAARSHAKALRTKPKAQLEEYNDTCLGERFFAVLGHLFSGHFSVMVLTPGKWGRSWHLFSLVLT